MFEPGIIHLYCMSSEKLCCLSLHCFYLLFSKDRRKQDDEEISDKDKKSKEVNTHVIC
jgi:hypothetical protein